MRKLMLIAVLVLVPVSASAQQTIKADVTVHQAPDYRIDTSPLHRPTPPQPNPWDGLNRSMDRMIERNAENRRHQDAMAIERERLSLERQRIEIERARAAREAAKEAGSPQPQGWIPTPPAAPEKPKTHFSALWAHAATTAKGADVRIDNDSVRTLGPIRVFRWAMDDNSGVTDINPLVAAAILNCESRLMEMFWPDKNSAVRLAPDSVGEVMAKAVCPSEPPVSSRKRR